MLRVAIRRESSRLFDFIARVPTASRAGRVVPLPLFGDGVPLLTAPVSFH